MERGDETRERLIRAARAAFAARGFAGASVRDVAAAAGVNPALVRYHFGSKHGLWERVVDEAMAALQERLAAQTEPQAILGVYLDHLAADPDVPRLIQRGLLDDDPVVVDRVTARLRPLVAVLDRLGERELGVTLFGAAVAPVLYAPVLHRLLGEDPLGPAALPRRRAHLERLLAVLLEEK